MEVPSNAVHLSMAFEGLYLKVYLCPAGYWTIGYGHLCRKDQPTISKEQAEIWLAEDLQNALAGTLHLCPVLATVDENWLGAIVDFTFNLGSGRLMKSTLRRRINQQAWDQVPYELNKWVYGGGKKLKGLTLRRQAEASFFTRG